MKNTWFILAFLCSLLSFNFSHAQENPSLEPLELKKRRVFQNGKPVQNMAALGKIIHQAKNPELDELFSKHKKQVNTSFVLLGVGAGMGLYGALTLTEESESNLPGIVELNETSLAIAGIGIGIEVIALVMNLSSWKKNGKPMIDRYNGIAGKKSGVSLQLTAPKEGMGLGFRLSF